MSDVVRNAVTNGTPTQPVPARPAPAFKGSSLTHAFSLQSGVREANGCGPLVLTDACEVSNVGH